jgi:hypothetical protein
LSSSSTTTDNPCTNNTLANADDSCTIATANTAPNTTGNTAANANANATADATIDGASRTITVADAVADAVADSTDDNDYASNNCAFVIDDVDDVDCVVSAVVSDYIRIDDCINASVDC